jgi:hypothetical protein
VIAQVYGAGGNAGALFTHDYGVLFNRGNQPASLDGLVLQYAKDDGVFGTQLVSLPSAVLQPGQYFLIQFQGGANGSALPTPDLISALAMGAAGGKVALVPATSLLSGCGNKDTSCSLTNVIDFVGYGSASQYEGSGHTPSLSATKAAMRKGGGCVDTDDNAADFDVATPEPFNTEVPLMPCP